MENVREINFYRHYFHDFFNELSEGVKSKIDYVLFVITVAEHIPVKFFKHVEGTESLYEIRVEYESNIYRIFCCFDDGKPVVLFNGFHKKNQKIPQQEIDKALEIKKMYFSDKGHEKAK
jgi:phage-related protein